MRARPDVPRTVTCKAHFTTGLPPLDLLVLALRVTFQGCLQLTLFFGQNDFGLTFHEHDDA
jgi:hypothetical protein